MVLTFSLENVVCEIRRKKETPKRLSTWFDYFCLLYNQQQQLEVASKLEVV
jgi:hypothetical protein